MGLDYLPRKKINKKENGKKYSWVAKTTCDKNIF
jgi:hypothetical protein